MYEPEDNFNLEESINRLKNTGNNKNNSDKEVSPERVAARQQQLEKIFLKLIAVGLGVGVILGIGMFILLTKLGMTKKPYQLEQEKQQPKNTTEQIQFAPEHPPQFQYIKVDHM